MEKLIGMISGAFFIVVGGRIFIPTGDWTGLLVGVCGSLILVMSLGGKNGSN
jgi:hypothetical protein